MTIQNKFTQEFNLNVPIVQGPMAGVSGPDLVAAVANNGGLGILPIWLGPIDGALAVIKKTQALTDQDFAVNIRADLVQLDHIKAATDAGVSIIHLFWGDPAASMPAVRISNARMIATVGDRDAALAALDAGASALIAQGVEAGGHVLGSIPMLELLPTVLDVAGDIPVIAAGGSADSEDVKSLLALGAQGVLFGSRFVASTESEAHDEYKQALINAGTNSTARSYCFDILWPNAPHRTLINSTYQAWKDAGEPDGAQRPGDGEIVLRTDNGQEHPRYSAMPPHKNMTGDILAGATYAGTGVNKITDCPSVAEIIGRIDRAL